MDIVQHNNTTSFDSMSSGGLTPPATSDNKACSILLKHSYIYGILGLLGFLPASIVGIITSARLRNIYPHAKVKAALILNVFAFFAWLMFYIIVIIGLSMALATTGHTRDIAGYHLEKSSVATMTPSPLPKISPSDGDESSDVKVSPSPQEVKPQVNSDTHAPTPDNVNTDAHSTKDAGVVRLGSDDTSYPMGIVNPDEHVVYPMPIIHGGGGVHGLSGSHDSRLRASHIPSPPSSMLEDLDDVSQLVDRALDSNLQRSPMPFHSDDYPKVRDRVRA